MEGSIQEKGEEKEEEEKDGELVPMLGGEHTEPITFLRALRIPVRSLVCSPHLPFPK